MGLPSTGSLEFGAPRGGAVPWGPFLVVREAQGCWRQEGISRLEIPRGAQNVWQADGQAMGGDGP